MKRILLSPLALFSILIAHTLITPMSSADYVVKEANFSYLRMAPAFNFYDNAYGFEIQGNRWGWKDETMGWGFVMGIHNWAINDRPEQIVALQEIRSLRGSASFLLVGLSWIYRPIVTNRYKLGCEIGSRFNYGLTSATTTIDLPNGSTTRGGGVDIASQITAVALLTSEWEINTDLRMALAAGYQGDIVKGEIAYNNRTFADNELATPIIRLGFVYDY